MFLQTGYFSCAKNYLSVGQDCVHEDIIIGVCTVVIAAALLVLVIVVIVLYYRSHSHRKGNKMSLTSLHDFGRDTHNL